MPHTSGPWEIRDHTVGHPARRAWIEINAPTGLGRMEHPICRIPAGFTNQDEDAWLIASAPDLLEACEQMKAVALEYMGFRTYSKIEQDAIDKIIAAVAKATGEPTP